MKWKRVVSLMVTAAMVFSLAACGSSSGSSSSGSSDSASGTASGTASAQDDGEPVYGGSVTIYDDDFAIDSTFDPCAQTSPWRLCYESLFAVDWTIDRDSDEAEGIYELGYYDMDDITGQIAESWEFDEDTAIVTVTLRDDVYFQDKEPFNGRQLVAEDVKWSYDRALGIDGVEQATGDIRTDWSVLDCVTGVEVVDDQTVAFQLDSSDELTLNTFLVQSVSLMIAGPEWDDLTAEQQTDYNYLCGTGPYVIDSFEADNYIKWVKNENYYAYDEDYPENKLPYLDEVTIMNYDSVSTQVTQFIAGDLDFLYHTSSNISDSEMATLESSGLGYTVYDHTTSPTGIAMKMCDANPALEIKEVREALNYAINLQEIWSDYYGNEGDLEIAGVFNASTTYSSMDEWDEEVYNAYATYDPEYAKQLLEEAGYGDGFEFSCAIFPDLDTDLYNLIAEYLQEIGVTMTINTYNTPPEMEAAGYDETLSDCMFVKFGMGNNTSMISQFFAEDGQRNCFLYSDDTITGLLEDCANATTVEEEEEAAQEIDTYVMSNYYQLMIAGSEQEGWYASDRIHGYAGENFDVKANYQSNALARIWVTDGK